MLTEKSELYDLIITDYSMPKSSGMTFIKNIKEKKINIPVILMSGHIDMITETKIKGYGIKAILTKPISIHALSDTLDNISLHKNTADGAL